MIYNDEWSGLADFLANLIENMPEYWIWILYRILINIIGSSR